MRFSVMLLSAAYLLAGACQHDDGPPGVPVDAPGAEVDAMVDAQRPVDAAVGTVCAGKDPVVQLIYTCDFVWSQCTGTSTVNHEIDCKIQAVGSLRFSLCDCKLGAAAQQQFTSTTICASASWAELEATANEKCGWDLR